MPARYFLLRKAKGKRALPLLNGRRLDQTDEEEVEKAQDQVACRRDHRYVVLQERKPAGTTEKPAKTARSSIILRKPGRLLQEGGMAGLALGRRPLF